MSATPSPADVSSPAREAVLAAAAQALANLAPAGAELTVRIVCGTVRVIVVGVPDPAGACGRRLPSQWQRILDILDGAGDWLPAVEVQRKLNHQFKGERATPEIYLRLSDMEEMKLVESSRAGYRLPH
jgi:hypothetical protein